MKKAEKAPKTADLAEQNLPGETLTVARAPSEQLPANAPTHPDRSTFTDSTTAVVRDHAADTTSPPAPAAVAGDARLLSLERTHDLVALHAVRLKETSANTMRIVLEPGDGTNLSLELRRQNGGIEAQATLHRGDFRYLSSHWAELQQRLEPRGVHLAALESSPRSAADNHQSHSSKRQAADEESGSAFSEFAFAGSMTESPASRPARRKSHQGWETWA